jgi:hypothetical protein
MAEFNNYSDCLLLIMKNLEYWANWNETTWFVAPTPNTTYTINICILLINQHRITVWNSATATTYVSAVCTGCYFLYGSLVKSI